MCILFVAIHAAGLTGAALGCSVGLSLGVPYGLLGLAVGLVVGYAVGLVGLVPLGASLELISVAAVHAREKFGDGPEPPWGTAAALALYVLIVAYLTALSLAVVAGAGYASFRAVLWLVARR